MKSTNRTRIKHFRKSRGLTLLELAEAVQTTPQTIQRLETGRMGVSLEWLRKIAAALGLAARDLLEEDASPTTPEDAFIGHIHNALVRNRRNVLGTNAPLTLMKDCGKLSEMLMEHSAHLRPWSDVALQAATVAASAMRIAMNGEASRKTARPRIMGEAA